MARTLIPLWQNWQFADNFEEQYVQPDCDETLFTEVQLPHTVKELPYHYFDEKTYQFQSCYRKKFAVSHQLQGMSLFIDFDGVMCYAKVFVNGRFIGEHKGGYVPFSVEITQYVEYGDEERNVLVVYVDSTAVWSTICVTAVFIEMLPCVRCRIVISIRFMPVRFPF